MVKVEYQSSTKNRHTKYFNGHKQSTQLINLLTQQILINKHEKKIASPTLKLYVLNIYTINLLT